MGLKRVIELYLDCDHPECKATISRSQGKDDKKSVDWCLQVEDGWGITYHSDDNGRDVGVEVYCPEHKEKGCR